MMLDDVFLAAFTLTDQKPPSACRDSTKSNLYEWLENLEAAKRAPFLIPELNGWLPENDYEFFRMQFYGPESILDDKEKFPSLIDSLLLPIGSCPNGDMVALDLEAIKGTLDRIPAVGYVSHEGAWSDENTPVREHFLRAADSLPELLLSIADDDLNGKDPRMDYWDIKEKGAYNNKVIEKYFSSEVAKGKLGCLGNVAFAVAVWWMAR